MATTIDVYSRDNCAQCHMTMKALDKAGVPYTVHDATDPISTAYIRDELGHASAPVVTIQGEGAADGEFQDWSGFRPEQIKSVASRLETSGGADSAEAEAAGLSGDSAPSEVGTRAWFLEEVARGRDFSAADFSDLSSPSDLNYAASADIDARVFEGANFSGSDLTGVTFNRCDLSQTDFTEADASLAQFWGSDVAGANFEGANLTGADLSAAQNVDAIETLADAVLDRANLTGVRFHEQAIGGDASYKHALLGLAEFDQVIISSANMEGADLSGASLKDVDAEDINLAGATAHGLVSNDVNLHNASLDRADLGGAYFENCNLRSASAEHTGFSGARFLNSDLEDANFDHSELQGAFFIEGTTLDEASFVGARLTGAIAGDLKPGQSLDARGAQFDNADLRGTRLRNADFTESSFRGADMRGADLTGANLTDADFTGANTDGLKLTDATLDGARGLSVTSADNSPETVLRGIHAHTLPSGLASVRDSAQQEPQTTAANPSAPQPPGADAAGPSL